MNDLKEEILKGFASAELQSQAETNVASGEDSLPDTREPTEIVSAPKSYKQEFKDSFKTLSPEWQKYLATREKEYEQGLSRARNAYGWVDKIADAKKDFITAQGFKNFEDYVSTLIGVADSLEKDPKMVISKLQSAYGISSAANDNTLQKQLSNQNAQISELQKSLEAFLDERAQNEYQAFLNAKDDKGKLKHIYFDDLKDQMQLLLETGLARNFEDAYNQAVWRVDHVREKVLEDLAKKQIERRGHELKRAQTASFEPMSKKDGVARELSLREEIERNFDRFGE